MASHSIITSPWTLHPVPESVQDWNITQAPDMKICLPTEPLLVIVGVKPSAHLSHSCGEYPLRLQTQEGSSLKKLYHVMYMNEFVFKPGGHMIILIVLHSVTSLSSRLAFDSDHLLQLKKVRF